MVDMFIGHRRSDRSWTRKNDQAGGIQMINVADDLKEQIEQKRSEMIDLGMEKGFTHQETIQASMELDELINQALKQQGSNF